MKVAGGGRIRLLSAVAGFALAADATGATYYVSAHAAAGGDGSHARPFASLADVERASGPDDSIIVLPSAAAVPPLDGGLALKPGQRLIGAGPAVIGRAPGADAPRISNARDLRLAGDAVRLADGSSVDNLVIVAARRSAVYGRDVRDARIERNDISATNTACVPGLLIYFPAESGWKPLANGFAAVMLDFDSARTSLDIEGNFIHDASCGDGIDVRANGTASVVSTIDGNVITRLRQGASFGSLLGIGLQTRDSAALFVSSSHNEESYLGNLFDKPAAVAWEAAWPRGDLAGANCEGLFTSQTGGSIVWDIGRNTFAHGIGGTSCNGAEFFVGAGRAELHVVVRDSIFEDNPGDMIEENNLGSESLMDVRFDNVTVRHATHAERLQSEAPVPELAFNSFTSRSACLSQFSVGPRAVTRFHMIRSHFSNCAGDGILAFHANLPGLGVGAGAASIVDVDQSSIVAVGQYALHWINYGLLDRLEVRVQSSRLEGGGGYPAVAANAASGAHVAQSRIDLGGGVLGSFGLNCFAADDALAIDPLADPVAAGSNWWGSAAANGPGTIARGTGSRLQPAAAQAAAGVSAAGRLAVPPQSCQLPVY